MYWRTPNKGKDQEENNLMGEQRIWFGRQKSDGRVVPDADLMYDFAEVVSNLHGWARHT